MKRVSFYTLGCKLNFSESSTIARQLEKRGHQRVEFGESSDVVIINTCSVTDHADKKCKKIVKEARKYSPDAYVAIIGCYAQLKPEEISQIPGVDAVLGANEKFLLPDLISGFERKEKAEIFASDQIEDLPYHSAFSLKDRTRTFLKVQDGCDYSCSFCTIPLARGKSRSDTIQNVLDNCKEIHESGVQEIVLTGINLGDFGIRNGERKDKFIDLVKAIDTHSDIPRFRISSIEPNLLSKEIIDAVAASEKFVPHFHVPLQSGNARILGQMRRRYKRELYVERVNWIKAAMPDACIGVDVIVGFPGETDEEFLDTYQFLNELDISYLHVFSYSERANTLAADIKPVIPNRIRSERSTQLRSLSLKKRRAFYESQLGKTYPVLFEAQKIGDEMKGFTTNYVKVSRPFDESLVNQIVPCKLIVINEIGDVYAEPVSELAV